MRILPEGIHAVQQFNTSTHRVLSRRRSIGDVSFRRRTVDADPFGEGVRTVGGEAGRGFDAKERLFFPVSRSKVNTGFGVGIFIPQLLIDSFWFMVDSL